MTDKEKGAMIHFQNSSILFVITCLISSTIAVATPPEGASSPAMLLRQGWAIQASSNVHEGGAAVSTPGFKAQGWYPATLPSTVLNALVEDRVYPDPYTDMNLRSIPGTTYPIFSNFSNLLMPPGSPFEHSWWFRTDFQLPAEHRGKTLSLGFDGINYRANVWMNGVQIASSKQMAGTWRLFRFDVTGAARPGAANSLAVEIFPPQPTDLAITLVDWAPMPPDKEMGIWRDVRITATGPVALLYPTVFTKLNLPSTDQAELTVRVELQNSAAHAIEGTLNGRIENIEFAQPARLGPGEAQVVRFTSEKFPQLKLANPRLWWPAQVGPQNLYPLDLQFECGGEISDAAHIQFGVRQVTSEIDANGHRLFHINGNKILIRGAGYSFDMLLRSSPERQKAELKYVHDLNLNAVRLEGKLVDDHFLDLSDQLGILVMPGWCCCDQWEHWGEWSAENNSIAAASLRDQIRRIERHPSVFTWLYGSDNPPPPKIEKMYLGILAECDWPNPSLSSAFGKATTVGPSGVKMVGPYEYVAPSFWYLDTRYGGAFGFNTETSPGPAIPPIETIRRMLPEDHLWPIDSWWEYHAGGMSRTLKVFTEALNHRYGAATSLEDYSRKAQVQAYEAHRAMMEAYGRNKYTSTGIIQWMLNNAWPSMIWHLFDWYLRPGGSYFGVKKACEPLHVQYSYDDHSIVVVNSYYRSFPAVKVTARVYNLDASERFSNSASVDIGADSSTRVFTLPEIRDLSSTYFVSLKLESSDKLASSNFYWLSTTRETIDWGRAADQEPNSQYQSSIWAPTETFADYTALNTLPQVDLHVTAQSRRSDTEGFTTVTLHNPSQSVAFAIRLKVERATSGRVSYSEGAPDDEVLPLLWQDNYFSLLPGETREVSATYNTKDLRGSVPVVAVEGWNVRTYTVQP
jgi:exo-1,4-beta-D-glucosaminidase